MDKDEVGRRVELGRVDVDELGEPARRRNEDAVGGSVVTHLRRRAQDDPLDRGHLGWVGRRRSRSLHGARV